MIEYVFAAAMILDPTPKVKVGARPAPPPIETVRENAAAPILSSVAVTLECTARANGRVEGCKVLGETHPGLGFGEAAIALMRDAQVEPGPRDIQFARTIQFTP